MIYRQYDLIREDGLWKRGLMNKGIVLVVDDDLVIHALLYDLLNILHYEVVEAWNGVEALELLDRVTPDLIILEKTMPQMDGVIFAEEMNQRGLFYPLIAFSAPETVYAFAEQIGAIGTVEKPFHMMSQLLNVLSTWRDTTNRM